MRDWTRRDFVKTSATGLAVMATGRLGWPPPSKAQVSLVHAGSGEREEAIRRAIELVGMPDVSAKWIAVKPNYNSADPFPGSTHPKTLEALVRILREQGSGRITVADRSGMGDSREVMEHKGVLLQAQALDFEALPLQDLPPEGWHSVQHPDLHWSQGFHLASVFREADAIVQTCCLKTHRFGGHFTLSLKNTVGMVAKTVPNNGHNFMRELHTSPHQRRMIAELNLSYEPVLVVMDAVQCFVDRGPDTGTVAQPNAILAATDRIALDAVGVAILREKGTTPDVSQGPIFGLEQIARAAELGIGVDAPERVEIVTDDPESGRYAETLREILLA